MPSLHKLGLYSITKDDIGCNMKITPAGNYDVKFKKIQNLGRGTDDNEAVNVKQIKEIWEMVWAMQRNLEGLEKSLGDIQVKVDDFEIEIDKIRRKVNEIVVRNDGNF